MDRPRSVRRLAAVLVTDIVEYATLMSVDETGTHERMLDLRRKIIDPQIVSFDGRVVKSTGDGVLAEFPSIVSAVQCAIELQSLLAQENEPVQVEQRLRWRMGVNYGDVILEGEDIFGDCVNVAVRLESLAEPGGICIPEKVYQEVRTKVPVTFELIGPQELKHIVEPITVYRSNFELGKTDSPGVPGNKASTSLLLDRPSVAVLPFVNLSADKDNQYLVDGLTEELIYDLSMSPEFFVIDRGSSFVFASAKPNLREVARTLGVRYLVLGTFKQDDSRIQVTAELVEAETGHQLWASRYKSDNPDIMTFGDEIARSIAASLMTTSGQIAKAELTRQVAKPPRQFTIYDRYLRARDYFHKSLLPPWDKGKNWSGLAKQEFASIIEMSDPPYWPAVAGLAWQHAIDFDWEYTDDDEESGRLAFELGLEAVKHAPELHLGQWVLGWAYLFYKHDHERAEYHYSLARELNVGDLRLLAEMAQLLIHTGRYEQAIMNLHHAIRLHPYHEQWYDEFLGWAYEENGEPEKAIEIMSRFSELEGVWSYFVLARSHLQLGHKAKAIEYLSTMDRLTQQRSGTDFTLQWWQDFVKRKDPYKDPARAQRVIDLARDLLKSAGRKP